MATEARRRSSNFGAMVGQSQELEHATIEHCVVASAKCLSCRPRQSN